MNSDLPTLGYMVILLLSVAHVEDRRVHQLPPNQWVCPSDRTRIPCAYFYIFKRKKNFFTFRMLRMRKILGPKDFTPPAPDSLDKRLWFMDFILCIALFEPGQLTWMLLSPSLLFWQLSP